MNKSLTNNKLNNFFFKSTVFLNWLALVSLAINIFLTTFDNYQIPATNLLFVNLLTFIWFILYVVVINKKTPNHLINYQNFVALSVVLLFVYLFLIKDITFLVGLACFSFIISSIYYANNFAVLISWFFIIYGLFEKFYFQDISYNYSINALRIIIAITGSSYLVLLVVRFLYSKTDRPQSQVIEYNDNALITLINNLSSGIIEINSQGQVELYNAGSLQILDTNRTLTNLDINEILPLKNLQDQKLDIKKIILNSRKITTRDDLIYNYSNNEQIRLELTISPVHNNYGINQDQKFLLIIRDVTKVKNLEQERDEFISVTSHELRTPISIAEGTLSNIEVMLDRGEHDCHLFQQYIKRAHQQILYLSTMTNDLAALARSQKQEIIKTEQINLRELAHQLYDKYQPEAEKKQLAFDLDLQGRLGHINSNSLYVEEILQNFITNAIRYTEKGSIKLIVKKDNLNTTFTVKDTGIGISKNEQKKIFDKFYRVEDFKTRKTAGTGLGLYVAKKLSVKIKGEIKVQSRRNFGSSFSLIIPNKF